MKRSLVIAMAALCLAAVVLGAMGQQPPQEKDTPLLSGSFKADRGGEWYVLFAAPAANLPRTLKGPGDKEVKILPVGNVRVIRADGSEGDTEGLQSFKDPLQLRVWIPADWKGHTTDRNGWRLYAYTRDPKQPKKEKQWIPLKGRADTGFLQYSAKPLEWTEKVGGYIELMISAWPAGDPPIGLGDGDF